MSYQVRHKEFGIFQGEFLGMGFWYPMSDQPEQGFCEFDNIEDAQEYIDLMCEDSIYKKEDFSIEDFNFKFSHALQNMLCSEN